MNDLIFFMVAPAAACLILSLTFTYFGIHVLKRQVIFVDLALAQLASMGVTLAFIMEIEPESWRSKMFSLLFILLGSAFFSLTRALLPTASQEAIIGIVYVVGSSLSILIVNHAPHGSEHIKNLLNGSILWMTWDKVWILSLVILLVATVHWIYRVQFFKLTESYFERASSKSQVGWDLLFYLTFGLVVAISVRTAGIYLIFTLLIIPALCGSLFFNSVFGQYFLGAAIGIVGSFIGLGISFFLDLPTGATLVSFFGAIFLFSLILTKYFRTKG